MTESDIKKNNKLIADFLGYRYNGCYVEMLNSNGRWSQEYTIEGDYDYKIWSPDSDWNQLMDAISKVAKIGMDFNGVGHTRQALSVCGLQICINIDTAYLRTVNFINWYNEQK